MPGCGAARGPPDSSPAISPAAVGSVVRRDGGDVLAGFTATRLHRAGRRGLLPSVPQDGKSLSMPQRGTNYFHLHLVSDATGETLITVARAAAAQYTSVSPVEHMHPLVRSRKQLDRVLAEIEKAPGIVLYTLLETDLAERLEKTCRELGAAVSLDPRPGAAACSSPISAARPKPASARSTCSTPNISSASTR